MKLSTALRTSSVQPQRQQHCWIRLFSFILTIPSIMVTSIKSLVSWPHRLVILDLVIQGCYRRYKLSALTAMGSLWCHLSFLLSTFESSLMFFSWGKYSRRGSRCLSLFSNFSNEITWFLQIFSELLSLHHLRIIPRPHIPHV